jgi:hypothetical protein
LPPDFQHDGAERIAGERIGGGPQRGVHIGRAHRHQQARIEAEFGQSAHRQRARFNLGEVLTHPNQRPPCRHPPRKARDKTGRRGTLPAGIGEHLVHRTYGEAALQRRIGVGMPERRPPGRAGVAMRLDALDTAAQSRKRARACACHARRSFRRGLGRRRFSTVNPQPAHLFMICSI